MTLKNPLPPEQYEKLDKMLEPGIYKENNKKNISIKGHIVFDVLEEYFKLNDRKDKYHPFPLKWFRPISERVTNNGGIYSDLVENTRLSKHLILNGLKYGLETGDIKVHHLCSHGTWYYWTGNNGKRLDSMTLKRRGNKKIILEFLKKNRRIYRISDLVKLLNLTWSNIKEALNELVEEGYVKKIERITKSNDMSVYKIKDEKEKLRFECTSCGKMCWGKAVNPLCKECSAKGKATRPTKVRNRKKYYKKKKQEGIHSND